jgi:uncharacterized membrane protein
MLQSAKSWSGWLKAFFGITAFSIFGTVLTKLTGLSPSYIPQIASILMIGCGVAVILRQCSAWSLGLGVLALGCVAELIGLYTDFPFGSYYYTDRWWPLVPLPPSPAPSWKPVMLFPVQLPFAWLMVVGGSFGVLERSSVGRFPLVLGTAVLATVIDFWMEAVMTGVFRYWAWKTAALQGSVFSLPGGAPVMNSIGWFTVSLAGAWLLSFRRRREAVLVNEAAIMLTGYCALMLVAYLFRV